MREAGKSTPAQSEKTTKGLPVPVWSIALLAIIALAVIFGPSLIAGMVEASASNQAANPGASGAEIETIVVSEETPTENKISSLEEMDEMSYLGHGGSSGHYYNVDEIPEFITLRNGMYVTNILIEGSIIKFSVRNPLNYDEPSRKITIKYTLVGEKEGEIKTVCESSDENQIIPSKGIASFSTKKVSEYYYMFPEMKKWKIQKFSFS